MKRAVYLRVAFFILSFVLFTGKSVEAQEPSHMANLILFVSFSDTEADYWNKPTGVATNTVSSTINRIYNQTGSYDALSVKDYFKLASCGKLEIDNIMPQMTVEESDYIIVPITLDSVTSSYADAHADYRLLKDTIDKLNEDPALLDNLTGKLDCNGDGYIDNVTFIAASPETEKDSALYPHKADGGYYNLSVKGVKMNHYNIINYGRLNGGGGAGVIAHEFLHVLGPLDTYVNCDSTGSSCDAGPVGCWDIMAEASWFTQYPLAYTRKELGWIDIKEASGSGHYTLTCPQNDSDRYALILKTPYSDTEFFVLEYRKQGSFDSQEVKGKIDAKIGGSGIIIYRVNTEADPKSNLFSNYIYLFRQGESEEQATKTGARQKGFFSEESGRTVFGSSDSSADSADGAITYTDGTNSGIIIKNVGSAAGDTITFDVEYTIDMSGKYWEKEKFSYVSGTYSSGIGVAVQDGQLYASDILLAGYEGALYGLRSNSMGNAELLCYTNGGWKCIQVLAQNSYGMDFKVGADGFLYIVCEQNYSTVKVYRMDKKGEISDITGVITPQGSVTNPKIAVTSAGVVIAYRDYKKEDSIHAYLKTGNTWKALNVNGASGNVFSLSGKGNSVYLATAHGDGNYVYQCDVLSSAAFVRCGSEFVSNTASSVDLVVDNSGRLYVAYYDALHNIVQVKGYYDGVWKQLGMNVYNQIVSDVKLLMIKEKMYVAYRGSSLEVKSYSISDKQETPSQDNGNGAEESDEKTIIGDVKPGSLPDENIPSAVDLTGKTVTDAMLEYVVTSSQAGDNSVECSRLSDASKKQVVIPATITVEGVTYKVTGIAKGAFQNSKKLTKVIIGDNVTTIHSSAFSGCKKLKSVTIGKNVTTIEERAFYQCQRLTKVTIPSKIRIIGKQAFFGCKKLKSITIKSTKLSGKTVGKQAFSGIPKSAVVKAPKKKLRAYEKLLTAKGMDKKVKYK